MEFVLYTTTLQWAVERVLYTAMLHSKGMAVGNGTHDVCCHTARGSGVGCGVWGVGCGVCGVVWCASIKTAPVWWVVAG